MAASDANRAAVKIITYDQIRNPYQFLKLMEPAFGWMTDPRKIAKWRKTDARYRSPYGFALQQGRNVLGFVGVADIPARRLDGKTENVGGIFAVATDPGHCRAGTATRLLERAHQHFREKGYRFSVLCTSQALVARSLYLKLGYQDIDSVNATPRAYRYYPEKKVRPSKQKRQPDRDRIQLIFDRDLKHRTGFASRIPNWLEAVMTQRELKPDAVIVRRDGYAFAEPWGDALFVSEIVADNRPAYQKLLKLLVKRTKRMLVIGYVQDAVLAGILRRQGFFFRKSRHFTFMAKPLVGVSFDQVFGNRFYLSGLDVF